ncbi:MAG: class I SAM-dependent methyltransferase, partial [Anaerolineae bacterium]
KSAAEILDYYMMEAPSRQSTLDIFKGEWSSRLPDPELNAGDVNLFDDPRIKWFIEQLGGVEGKTVLELGPLEAGHTYMLERAGAASILGIEANTRAYLKCLVIKELFGLQRSHFLCGNFMAYLADYEGHFDVCLASGVLYHMTDPVALIAHLANVTDHVCIWTHYYDPDILAFSVHQPSEYDGFSHMLHVVGYGEERDWAGFCGAGTSHRCWLTRDEIIGAFEYFGLSNITIGLEEPDHPHGPAITLIASR